MRIQNLSRRAARNLSYALPLIALPAAWICASYLILRPQGDRLISPSLLNYPDNLRGKMRDLVSSKRPEVITGEGEIEIWQKRIYSGQGDIPGDRIETNSKVLHPASTYSDYLPIARPAELQHSFDDVYFNLSGRNTMIKIDGMNFPVKEVNPRFTSATSLVFTRIIIPKHKASAIHPDVTLTNRLQKNLIDPLVGIPVKSQARLNGGLDNNYCVLSAEDKSWALHAKIPKDGKSVHGINTDINVTFYQPKYDEPSLARLITCLSGDFSRTELMATLRSCHFSGGIMDHTKSVSRTAGFKKTLLTVIP